jgi:hypothetical protein
VELDALGSTQHITHQHARGVGDNVELSSVTLDENTQIELV